MYLQPDHQQFNHVMMRTFISLMLVKQVNWHVLCGGGGGARSILSVIDSSTNPLVALYFISSNSIYYTIHDQKEKAATSVYQIQLGKRNNIDIPFAFLHDAYNGGIWCLFSGLGMYVEDIAIY